MEDKLKKGALAVEAFLIHDTQSARCGVVHLPVSFPKIILRKKPIVKHGRLT